MAAPNRPVAGAAVDVAVEAAAPPNELLPPKLNEEPRAPPAAAGWVDAAEPPNEKGDA